MGAWVDRLRNSEDLYWAWMAETPHMTPGRMARLIRHFGEPQDIFGRSKKETLPPLEGVPDELRASLRTRAREELLDRMAGRFEKLGVFPVCLNNAAYPELLIEIAAPPLVLYCRGKGSLDALQKKSIAIVGSRKATEYAQHTTRRIARELAQSGVTIVSGMALGVDAAAHWGALEGGAGQPLATVAVLAGGVDCIYPACHSELYRRILENGLAISEHPIGMRPAGYHFPLRNRIIAGLSMGTLVAEAAEKSGTKHTVNYALESGRDVFALPGRAQDPACMGSNALLRQGARLVTSAKEILEEYPWWKAEQPRSPLRIEPLSAEEEQLCALLKLRDHTADELFEATQIPMGHLLSLLTKLSEKGIIERKSYMCFHYILN